MRPIEDRQRTESVEVALPQDMLTALDGFRIANQLPSRAAAARELLRRGLDLAAKQRLG